MAIASYGPLSDETGKTRYRVEALSTVKGAVLARIEGVADRDGGRGDCGDCGSMWSASDCRRRASGSGTRRT